MPLFNTVVGGGSGGSGSKALHFTVTLLNNGWKEDESDPTTSYQEISNDNLIIDNYSYFVAPDEDSYLEYIDASIRAFDIKVEGKIRFVCLTETKSTENLVVDILRVEETYDE